MNMKTILLKMELLIEFRLSVTRRGPGKLNLTLILTLTYLSKKGKDYIGGGVYLIGNKGEKINVENQIDIGDMSIGYSTLRHGVDPVDINSKPDINKTDGRWFLGLYSNDSDHKKDRHTANPENFKMSALISDE